MTNINDSCVLVPEWLTGMTRNHVGFARAGSNPAKHAFFNKTLCYSCSCLLFALTYYVLRLEKVGKLVHGGLPNMCNDFIVFLLCS